MNATNPIKKILVANTWQENSNTWIFSELVIHIKNHSTPHVIRHMQYSIESTFDNQFILRTRKDLYGDLLLKINYKNPLPKLLMRSEDSQYFELHAHNRFTVEQKFMIHKRVTQLKSVLEAKKKYVADKIKLFSISDHSLFVQHDTALTQLEIEVEGLKHEIQKTMNIAYDFRAYFHRINSDIEKLEKKINALV